ncbi:MAG: hypothetical protein ACREDS_02625, partial [Limisphaerales bacterium]
SDACPVEHAISISDYFGLHRQNQFCIIHAIAAFQDLRTPVNENKCKMRDQLSFICKPQFKCGRLSK